MAKTESRIDASVKFESEGTHDAYEFLKFYVNLADKNKVKYDPERNWMVSWEHVLDNASGNIIIREKKTTSDMVNDLKDKLNRNPFKRKFARNIPEPWHNSDSVYDPNGVYAGIMKQKTDVLKEIDCAYWGKFPGLETERKDGVALKIKLKDVERKTLVSTYDDVCRRIYEKSDGTYTGKVYSKDGKKSLDVKIPLFDVIRDRAVYGRGTGISYRVSGDASQVKEMNEQLEAKAQELGGIYTKKRVQMPRVA